MGVGGGEGVDGALAVCVDDYGCSGWDSVLFPEVVVFA